MSPIISVIVPTYNAEKTIQKCVCAILAQTFGELEAIVINDGSTDNTEGIVSALSKADKRVRLITVPNGGVSHARNVGIENARGEYLTFVDADDTIEKDMYAHLISLVKKYGVQIAHCSYNNVKNGSVVSSVGNNGKELLQTHDEALECLISGRYFAGGMWNKLYAAKLFDGVRLDESIWFNEDVLANFLLFKKADSSVYSDRALYNYVQSGSGATHSMSSLEKSRQSYYVYKKIYEMSKGEAYERAAEEKLAFICLNYLEIFVCWGDRQVDKEETERIKKIVRSYKKRKLYKKRNEKIRYAGNIYFPLAYRYAHRVFERIRNEKLDPGQ